MRPNILTLLLTIFTVTIATAQLYDNRSRYLRTPKDVNRYERNLNTFQKPTRRTYYGSSQSYFRRKYSNYKTKSYNSYNSRVYSHTKPSYGSREFYNRFRSPKVFEKYIDNERHILGSPETPNKPSINFKCFCFVPIDINSILDFYTSNNGSINADRDAAIKNQEEEYSKEMSNRGFHKNYGESFKDQQKRFFKAYVQNFDSGYEGGKRTTYNEHKKRFLNDIKSTAERFDTRFEYQIATSEVFSFLTRYKSNPRNTSSVKKYVGDLKVGQQYIHSIPPNNYGNYNLVKSLLQKGDIGSVEHLHVRNLYNYLRKPSTNLYDYLTDRYIKQYDNEYNLYKRFAFQSAYLIDHIQGHQLTNHDINRINDTFDFSGYMQFVTYDHTAIMNFYRNNPIANSGYSMSFEKAKAIMAFNGFPSLVKRTIEIDGNIKNSVMNYLSNAVPMNYELNTIRDAINSRYNDAFRWSELPYFKTRSFQKRESPETIMSIYLEKTDLYHFSLNQYGLNGSLILDLGATRYAYKMHEGIGDVLKKMYNNPIYAGKEGATIRHFLKEKGLNVPSSLSNYELGKLFDFGGGNSNTLTIEFSDYAKKFIINFHHGDGVYGSSLFTDLLKLAALHDILKGKPVDFSKVNKPCLGDPIFSLEIAPQKNSGIAGGMFGCTRNGNNCPGKTSKKYHNGMDFKARYGDPIHAMYDGTAESLTQYDLDTGSVIGAGHYVEITSIINGKTVKTLYFHLKEKGRRTGQVKAGDIIGYLGRSGNLEEAIKKGLTESHLHIKVKENNIEVDPNDYLSNPIDPNTGKRNQKVKCN